MDFGGGTLETTYKYCADLPKNIPLEFDLEQQGKYPVQEFLNHKIIGGNQVTEIKNEKIK